ncbi:MAG: HD domain-containing phosphohydrolase [Peptococcia bacterium]
MKELEIKWNKIMEQYVFITQVFFLLLLGFLLLSNINNVFRGDSYLYRQIIFLVMVLLACGFYGVSFKKKGEKSSFYLDNTANAIYFALVIFYLFFEKESVFKFLLLMPVLGSALRYGFKTACFWAFMGTMGIGVISFVQHFAKLPVNIFVVGILWFFAIFLSKISTVDREIQQEKVKSVSQDDLMGLYHGPSFYYYLDEYSREAQQKNNNLALMLIDVDFFKYYNDTYGYQKGDEVLKRISEIIFKVVGDLGKCMRYGRDEFAIFIPNCDGEQGYRLGEKIREEVETAQIEGMGILPGGHFSISVGVASFPEQAATKEKLLQMADEALYNAKYTNGNGVELYYSVLDEIGRTLQDREKSLLNSLRTLLMVVNAKDKYTYGHSERVMHYAMQIGRRLALWEWEIQDIIVGGLLHDIGKIEISREILNKPARLSEQEWIVIKNHCMWGADIIRPISVLSGAVDIVLHHHENYNGTGYPIAISSTEIPLGARILRVADSFDAMTTNRPYKKVKTFDEALFELEKYKGVYYDPEVVDTFIVYIQETGILKNAIVN